MKNGYYDIVDHLGPPTWWDEHGVPRYCNPAPEEVANIYAREVAFCVIACQACGFQFLVAFSWCSHEFRYKPVPGKRGKYWKLDIAPRLSEVVHELHYGDPPNYFWPGIHTTEGKPRRCCHVGATMNSENLGCIRFYEQPDVCKPWKRNKQAEWGDPNGWWSGIVESVRRVKRPTLRISKAPSPRSRSRGGAAKGKRGQSR